MFARRKFLNMGLKAGLVGATSSLWSNTALRAFGQAPADYKAMIMVSLVGGNDGNNLVIPMDKSSYAEYCAIRPTLALPQSACLPLNTASGTPSLGLHPNMVKVAQMFNQGKASIVANVGPLMKPVSKEALLADPTQIPAELLSHPAGRLQWATSSTGIDQTSGWGGRLADRLTSQSGQLPPFFNASNATVLTVGEQVQAISVQANTAQFVSLGAGMNEAILQIAQGDFDSKNQLVAQTARLRYRSMVQQVLIEQAQQYGQGLKTVFPDNPLGSSFHNIVQLMQGRSVIGASRQLFYCEQDGSYDTHSGQLIGQATQLAELDAALGALMQGLQEIGLSDSVLVCTSSDFNRTMQANSTVGTDHGWGNHHLVLGGTNGGRIIGSLPELELGGSFDLLQQGIWIPSLSVTQFAAGIGSWLGLPGDQLNAVFPDLKNFTTGAISL